MTPGLVLRGKKIVLGVCSSISIYKAAELLSRLLSFGSDVHVVMTENATKLMSPRIFQTLSRNDVYCSMWDHIADWKPEHIALAESADLLLVAPATANTIGNFANGLAPDMLSAVFLATLAKVQIAPAMNCNMYANPAVIKNIAELKARGVFFTEPEDGKLACGITGRGRLASIDSIIADSIKILSDL